MNLFDYYNEKSNQFKKEFFIEETDTKKKNRL